MTTADDQSRPEGEDAEDLFADYLAKLEAGQQPDIDGLCRENAPLDGELRSIARDWDRLENVYKEAFDEDSLSNTLARGLVREGAPQNLDATSLYARFLVNRRRGSEATFEQLLDEQPSLADDLRRVDKHWRSIEQIIERLGQSERLNSTNFIQNARKVLGGNREEQTRDLIRLLLRQAHPDERYRIESEIGAGGMGRILEVTDKPLRRRLAMKVLKGPSLNLRDSVDTDPLDHGVARFLEEAQVTSQLDHPGVVPVHELGIDEQGNPFFTMKKVRGDHLGKIFERHWAGDPDWSLTRILQVFLRVCDALAYAHAKGVVHRDVKPANIMIGRFGETYLMDWGLAKVVEDATAEQFTMVGSDRAEDLDGESDLRTHPGQGAGTPVYMPVEQARGKTPAKPTMDIYAVGAMLYHLLAKTPPFLTTGERISGQEVLKRLLAGAPAPIPRDMQRDIAPELISITERAMSRDAQARYGTVLELGADLQSFLEDRVVKAHRTGPLAELRKWSKRNRAQAVSGFVTAAGVTLTLAALSGMFHAQKIDALVEKEFAQTGQQKAVRALVAKRQELKAVQGKLDAARTEKLTIERQITGFKQEAEGLARSKKVEVDKLQAATVQARQKQAEAEAERAALARLSIRRRVDDLLKREADLYPIREATLAQAIQWTKDASALVLELDSFEADLTELEERAVAVSNEQLRAYQATTPQYRYQRVLEQREDGLRDEIAGLEVLIKKTGHSPYERMLSLVFKRRQAETGRERQRVDGELATLRPYEFDGDEADLLSWRLLQLQQLQAVREQLRKSLIPRAADRIERFELAQDTAHEASEDWNEAIAAIADPKLFPLYRGLRLKPQPGLVPLGSLEVNTEGTITRLYQFWHASSGTRPQVDAAGEVSLNAESGLVLVLIPRGTFKQGVSRDKADSSIEFDKSPMEDEIYGQTAVRLDAFFMSRFEVSQAQWTRWEQSNPSVLQAASRGDANQAAGSNGSDDNGAARYAFTPLHPVESVEWGQAQSVLRSLGLKLPTEAQWEYACRAGTTSELWVRNKFNLSVPRELRPVIADSLSGNGVRKISGYVYERQHEDNYDFHAPVSGTDMPNPWGLHHVIGNVSEWCRDTYIERYSFREPRAGDGLRDDPSRHKRVIRGGSFKYNFDWARSARRHSALPTARQYDVGIRPMMEVER